MALQVRASQYVADATGQPGRLGKLEVIAVGAYETIEIESYALQEN